MAFSEFWLGGTTDISKDFYENQALGVLEKLTSHPRKFIHIAAGKRAAELYAEARRCDASAKADLTTNPTDKSFWRGKSKRWSEALGQLRENKNSSLLSHQLYQESLAICNNPDNSPRMEKFGEVLLDLSNIVTRLR